MQTGDWVVIHSCSTTWLNGMVGQVVDLGHNLLKIRLLKYHPLLETTSSPGFVCLGSRNLRLTRFSGSLDSQPCRPQNGPPSLRPMRPPPPPRPSPSPAGSGMSPY